MAAKRLYAGAVLRGPLITNYWIGRDEFWHLMLEQTLYDTAGRTEYKC
jgi:hypothetical protein